LLVLELVSLPHLLKFEVGPHDAGKDRLLSGRATGSS
jgi:hypothetical protein